ncbi:hypothetical protein [uncultured Clostridium sp.]|uniref:hypothetical protein n=1 Tax=uncultured Clostridium sp. TaxID=59620 RepID=UPI002617B257|nr:hypothetical protein [uncultured Clostridium sp.]
MAKRTSRNDDFLFSCKNTIASSKLYNFIAELVNEDKVEEAKIVASTDYLLDYLVSAIKARDRFSTMDTSKRIKEKLKELEDKNINAPLLKESFDKIIKMNKLKL